MSDGCVWQGQIFGGVTSHCFGGCDGLVKDSSPSRARSIDLPSGVKFLFAVDSIFSTVDRLSVSVVEVAIGVVNDVVVSLFSDHSNQVSAPWSVSWTSVLYAKNNRFSCGKRAIDVTVVEIVMEARLDTIVSQGFGLSAVIGSVPVS